MRNESFLTSCRTLFLALSTSCIVALHINPFFCNHHSVTWCWILGRVIESATYCNSNLCFHTLSSIQKSRYHLYMNWYSTHLLKSAASRWHLVFVFKLPIGATCQSFSSVEPSSSLIFFCGLVDTEKHSRFFFYVTEKKSMKQTLIFTNKTFKDHLPIKKYNEFTPNYIFIL